MDIFKANIKSLFGKLCMVNDTKFIAGTLVGFSDTSGSDSLDVNVSIRTLEGEYFDTSYDMVSVITPQTIEDFLNLDKSSVYEQCDNFVKVSLHIALDLFNKYPDTSYMELDHTSFRINNIGYISSPFPSLPEEVIRVEICRDNNPYSFKFFLKDKVIFYKW